MMEAEIENIDIIAPQVHFGKPEQEPYFNQLSLACYDPEKIHSIIIRFLNDYEININDFPLDKGSYSRTILFRNQSYLELMIARWDKGAKTQIHGHPDFVYEYLIDGLFQIESFKKNGSYVNKIVSNSQQPGEFICLQGFKGQFDNAIHRITAKKESLSLHIYSDNALKGEIFTDFKTF